MAQSTVHTCLSAVKGLRRLLWASLPVLLSFAFPHPTESAEVVSLRAFPHKDFHRLTIILSEEVSFKVKRQDEVISFLMQGVDPKPLKETPSTDLVKVSGLKKVPDGSVYLASLDVTVPAGSQTKQTVKLGPYRILLDVFPPKNNEPKAPVNTEQATEAKKEAEQAQGDINLSTGPVSAGRLAAFNDGWRWVYRKKAVELLKAALYENDLSIREALRDTLGLSSSEKDIVMKEAGSLVNALRSGAQASKSETLRGILVFYGAGKGADELESVLRANPASGYDRLGYFMLGDYFERKGFLPEASAYFTLAAEGKENTLRPEALYRKGRLFFFRDRYADAKEVFRQAYESGHTDSGVWLANTCLIKGELDLARQYYRKSVKDADGLDPVTRLSIGDMALITGDFAEARFTFGGLRARYPKNEFLTVFLTLKEADSYLIEGNTAEALRTYSRTKERLKGEPWSMAALSLADGLLAGPENEGVSKAAKIYEAVSNGGFLGSQNAHLRLVNSEMRLGRFSEAIADIEKFLKKYPTSPLRNDFNRLSSQVYYNWIGSLYASGDHFGVVKVYSGFPVSIPFGKKTETSIKVSRSYIAVGLSTEAVKVLDSVIKLGNGPAVEEAMVELAEIYLTQKDTDAAERLINAFRAQYPGSAFSVRADELYSRIAFKKGEFGSALKYAGAKGDARALIMKAESLDKLNRLKEALPLYERAARSFKGSGDNVRAKGAFIKIADANFSLGNYELSIESYRKAIELMGESDKQDRSWALYRLAQGYSRLDRKDQEELALKELKGLESELGSWSVPIFRDAKSL